TFSQMRLWRETDETRDLGTIIDILPDETLNELHGQGQWDTQPMAYTIAGHCDDFGPCSRNLDGRDLASERTSDCTDDIVHGTGRCCDDKRLRSGRAMLDSHHTGSRRILPVN